MSPYMPDMMTSSAHLDSLQGWLTKISESHFFMTGWHENFFSPKIFGKTQPGKVTKFGFTIFTTGKIPVVVVRLRTPSAVGREMKNKRNFRKVASILYNGENIINNVQIICFLY